jgi:hypothetical protein
MDSDAREWNIGCSYFRVVGAIERAGGLDGDGSRWMAIWVYLRVEDMVMVMMVMVMMMVMVVMVMGARTVERLASHGPAAFPPNPLWISPLPRNAPLLSFAVT